jgi:Cu(I)/Ag(I) efflux system periplasmic protein CusF
MRVVAMILMLVLGASAWAQGAAVDGEVRKVDKEAGKVTIKHGPIPQFEMGAMTMVFRVKEPAMLDRLKAGDRISFVPDKVGGAFTVMSFEAAK